ncbi:CrcB family protein [Streptomyces sp. DW26H14]|uniref:CrcB family protein n=1 Tax=Streptomyces sp. DW26H14 TaxID=3435395 RepID=UPI00403DB17C
MPLLLMMLGGLAGGTLRYRAEKLLHLRARRPGHWGPFSLNFLGSFLLGAASGWTYHRGMSGGTTLLGGMIAAYAACGYEAFQLLRGGRLGVGVLSVAGGWFVGLMAAVMGAVLVMN